MRANCRRRCTLWASEDQILLEQVTIKVTVQTLRQMLTLKARGKTLALSESRVH